MTLEAIDIIIIIISFLIIFLMFLQPSSQDRLAGFLSGSTDVSSYQSTKERGTTKILTNLTWVILITSYILLIVVRVT